MTTDAEYRKQVKQIRQTARKQVLAIEADRIRQKRLRRATRLAQLPVEAQDMRLEAALEAGRIELWEPVVAADAVEVLREYFGPPWEPALAYVALPPEAYFGPHMPVMADAALLTLSTDMRIGVEAVADVPVDPLDDADWEDVIAASVVAPQPVGDEADLMTLPGAGPGLIWMLQKCGITTLADLADTDAAALVPKLGLVGQIVDIHGWQSFARAQVGSVPRSVTG